MRKLVLACVVVLTGCGTVQTYRLKSSINEAVFYRARYIDSCVTMRQLDVPCEAWAALQTKLDAAGGEGSDAMQVGGSEHLQIERLKKLLAEARKEFSKWLM